jgi:hypothetical protein
MQPLERAVAEVDLNGHDKEVDSEANGNSAKEERLIVGVDFGTTYSGYIIPFPVNVGPSVDKIPYRVAVVYSGAPDDVGE